MFVMPETTVWPLEPHTAAKHSILRRYLQGYYPKMASAQRRLVFVDGFAGPGEYVGGKPGSPVIALDTLTGHNQFPRWSDTEFLFLFIEEDAARFELLSSTLAAREDPANVRVATRCGSFQEHMTDVLDRLGTNRLAPAFVMVDPFGVKGLPLDLLRRLAKFPKTELLVSFMYESISRWHSQPNYEVALDELFGRPDWRDAEGLEGEEKKAFLSGLYATQLQGIGMDYVRLFEMGDAGNRTEYFLAFGTHSHHGLRVMKNAMWTVDRTGGVKFSDFTAPDPGQGVLFEPEPNYPQLRALLHPKFAGEGQVPIEEIDCFVLTETAFLEKHGKTVLREDEAAGSVKIHRPSGRRKNYLNEGTVVTFPLL
ncbi:MAG: three-Cys-motif partner protein TcmP [Dehalococcoidia bacterium]|nr:three-Cys-motif partner protein TcmP [Dehalococcoidia bacterium]MYA52007.1 three-Cys-motif partner protein TcmP [Dehalococcoidia bacterium]